jgi:hypothetical protein
MSRIKIRHAGHYVRRSGRTLLVRDRNDLHPKVSGGALPYDAVAAAVLEQRLRERREPTDRSVCRVRFIFSDNAVCLSFFVGLLYGYACAETHDVPGLFARVDHDRRFKAFLQVLNVARITGGLRLCKPLLKLVVTRGRHVIGVLTLRPRSDDFIVAVVLFNECATHGVSKVYPTFKER